MPLHEGLIWNPDSLDLLIIHDFYDLLDPSSENIFRPLLMRGGLHGCGSWNLNEGIQT